MWVSGLTVHVMPARIYESMPLARASVFGPHLPAGGAVLSIERTYIQVSKSSRPGQGAQTMWARVPRRPDDHLGCKGNSKSHGARPVHQNYLDDEVDSDQQVVNKELSASRF